MEILNSQAGAILRSPADLEPIDDALVVRMLPRDHTPGGLALPDNVEMPQVFEVLAVGPGKTTEYGEVIPVPISVGDYVICRYDPVFQPYHLPFMGDQIFLVKHRDLLAKVRRT